MLGQHTCIVLKPFRYCPIHQSIPRFYTVSESILLKTKSEELKIGSEESCRTSPQNIRTRNWCFIRTLHGNACSDDFTRNPLTELCTDVELTIVQSIVSLSHITSNINDSVDSDFYQLQHSTCPIK